MLLRPFVRNGRPGLIGTMARTTIVVGTGKAVAGGLSRRQQARAGQAPAPPPAAPADPIAQLKDLAALRDQGVLTEEEFAAQKARILGS
jgi:Short C-terminal domain